MRTCHVCQREGLTFSSVTHPNADGYRCICDGCGAYDIDGFTVRAKLLENIDPLDRLRLAGAVRRAADAGERVFITDENYKTIIASEHLPDAVEQADRLIAAVGRRSTFGRFSPGERGATWTTRLYLPDWHALKEMTGQIADLLGMSQSADGPHGPEQVTFKLTLRGWDRYKKIPSRHDGSQAFVAMWFHEEMGPIYGDGIKPALEDTGHAPYRIDFSHHLRRIDDEIMLQIRQSRIVVAEATGNRASVYYEAGFAEGLGIPVIWCCNEKSYRTHVVDPLRPHAAEPPGLVERGWFDCVAFDTNHLPFVLWNSVEELRKKLADRIAGLGLSLTVRR